jgi:glutathione S-transferase
MSPFVRKVLVFCAEKGIEVESVPVGLGSTDELFRAASPFGKMPAMIDGDFALADSSAILHYLEAKHPEPPLIPQEAREKGKAIWFEEYADTILSGCGGKMFFNRVVAPIFLKREGDLAAADRAEKDELPPILAYLERELEGKDWLVGNRITIADVAVACSLANLEHAGVSLPPHLTNVSRYQTKMGARPSLSRLLDRERAYLARSR